MNRLFCVVLMIVLWFGGGMEQNAHAGQPPTPLVNYRSPSGVAAEDLVAGATGEAFLLYYMPERSVSNPGVVVHLEKATADGAATATLYTPPIGQSGLPLTFTETGVIVDPTLPPALVIEASAGWWVRDGIPNYNLDMQVYTPAYAIWGGVDDPEQEPTSWQANLAKGELAVTITVRDRDGDGQPDWEWRDLVPPFPGKGYYRTHYAESTCTHPRTVMPGITPLFPYLGLSGSFEQPAGEFHPPLMVNWAEGQLTHISEMVAVRNTPCNYTFYSVSSVARNIHNQPNFETPFAFYDLGDTGSDLPNLILRTERYPARDPWSLGIDPAVQGGVRPVPSDLETIRYSWRTAPGDGRWDYKLEMLGFLPYMATTPIGDGQTTIDAPSYADFPLWTLAQEWPVVTFVAAEGRAYESTEGIYEWSPFELGIAYLFGWHDRPKAEALHSIPPGLRGEYRYTGTDRPLLYFSPIDERLHLKGAEGGLWNLGTGGGVRLHSSNHTYIDGWTRHEEENEVPLEALYRLDGYLLYAGGSRVILKQTDVAVASFSLVPPHDSASWNAFNAKLDRKAATPRPGNDLYRWFAAHEGKTVTLPATTLEAVRTGAEGYQFILHPARTIRVNVSWFPQGTISAGEYQLIQGEVFTLVPVVTAPLTLTLSAETEAPAGAHLLVTNPASYATEALRVLAIATNGDEEITLLNQPLQLEGGAYYSKYIAWDAPTAGEWQMSVRVEDSAGDLIAEQTLSWTRSLRATTPSAVWDVSASATWMVWVQAVLVGLIVVALGVIFHRLHSSTL